MLWLLRLIIFAALAWLLYRAVRKVLMKPEPPAINPGTSTLMRRCADCGIHIAEPESTQASGQFFCSTEHRDRWLNQHKTP